ncbi:ATP-binding protein [Streptomyces sp. NPDC056149]|uniref:ATP-binding protein n=1 Tax=Streptomyces sp. NPDC056149 TaxID=3345728 RepID=UPI0035D73CFB
MPVIGFTSTRATAVVTRDTRAAAEARRLLETVSGAGTVSTDTAALLLSEVVSNAVRHAEGATIKMVVVGDQARGTVTCAVFDSTADMGRGPRRGDAPLDELETGRGLDILDALADRWGVTMVGAHGKWVWFRVTVHERVPALAA